MTNTVKDLEARIGINTNPATAHLGRYTLDIRNVTGGRDVQTALWTTDTPAEMAADLTKAGLEHGVMVTMIDETGE